MAHLNSVASFALVCMLLPLWAKTIFSSAALTNEEMSIARESFMAAMRSSGRMMRQEAKERQRRLQSSLLAAAIPKEFVSLSFHTERDLANHYYGNDNGNDDEYSGYGFNISAYSLKYAGCSAISTYSDDLAQNEDASTVFDTQQYVVFRLCPSNKCQDKSAYGCMSNYGEYMLPIATWLDIMKDYRDEEYERYCTYCQQCLGNGRDLGNNYYYYDANGGGSSSGSSSSNYCSNTSSCTGYANVCNNDARVDYSKFFECKALQVSDDFTLYIGPHCSTDKTTIVLGAFTDDSCTMYAGHKYDLGTLTGMKLTSSDLAQYYTSDCIPCKESNLAFQSNDYYDSDDISEVCESLYGYAAKCNRYIGGHTSKSYQSYQQDDTETSVCTFIASVVTGTYDEYGFIYVDPSSFESDNKYNQYSKIGIRKGVVTKSQTFGLTVFTFTLVSLCVWVVMLHKEIKLKNSMKTLNRPFDINRKDSGIMMARSLSHDSRYDAPPML